jgi:hypothetical protein
LGPLEGAKNQKTFVCFAKSLAPIAFPYEGFIGEQLFVRQGFRQGGWRYKKI